MIDDEKPEVLTTVTLELEGKLVHATSDKTVEQIEGLMQAEHLIPIKVGDEEIKVQAGAIEFLRAGDKRDQQLQTD